MAESIPLSDQNGSLKNNDSFLDQNGNLKSRDSSPDREGDIKSHDSSPEREQKTATSQLDRKVWIIFCGLAVSAVLSALEGSVVSTALPTIAADLGLGGNYVWVINIYFLTR